MMECPTRHDSSMRTVTHSPATLDLGQLGTTIAAEAVVVGMQASQLGLRYESSTISAVSRVGKAHGCLGGSMGSIVSSSTP